MVDLISFPALLVLSFLVFLPQLTSSFTPPPKIDKPAVYTSFHSLVTPTPPGLPVPTILLTPTPPVPTPTPDNRPWGQAEQISEHSWVIRINNDPQMGTPNDILQALNDLRARYGAQPLKTDPRLCDYAQQRADYFKSIHGTDEHQGLADYLSDDKNFDVLGYNWIGENSSYGYIMSGVHLIEFVYNADPDHSQNQLDPKWDHGCVGVNSPATDLIFATSPR